MMNQIIPKEDGDVLSPSGSSRSSHFIFEASVPQTLALPQTMHYLQNTSIPGPNIWLPDYILLSSIDFHFRVQPQLNFGGKKSTLSSFIL